MSWDYGDEQRDRIEQVIKEVGPAATDGKEDEFDPETRILTGWVMVAEWMDKNGPFLTRGWDKDSPSWRARGLLHEGLYGEWPEVDEGEE